MNFGKAVELLKEGNRVARKGWNGKGMFVYYVSGSSIHHLNHPNGNFGGTHEDDLIIQDPYIAMKTVQNTVVPWLASQSDILAEDWEIVS